MRSSYFTFFWVYFLCVNQQSYFTVEMKGFQGYLDIATLQNPHNSTIMLNNMVQLKRAFNKEHEMLGRIQVITMELNTESIPLWGHLVVQGVTGIFEFYSFGVSCGSAMDPTGKAFKDSY
jgi:hypothetical protein